MDKARGKASLIKTNEDGFVTHENVLAFASSFDTLAERCFACEYAEKEGWQTADPERDIQVSDDGEMMWLYITPLPVSVAFVGSRLPDNALELAQTAGVPAIEMLKVGEPDEGKVRAWFTVETPRDFVWSVNPDWAWLVGL